MESNIVHVSLYKTQADEPSIENIKCEYNYEDTATESELSYINVPEEGAGFREEESSYLGGIRSLQLKVGHKNEISSGLHKRRLSGIFKCKQCDFFCTSINDLIIHYRKYREDEPFKCFHCGFNGRGKNDFIIHSHMHLKKPYFKCTLCPFTSEVESTIVGHIQDVHSQTPPNGNTCPLCNKILTSKWNTKLHLSRCKGLVHQNSELSSSNDFEVTVKTEPDKNSSSSVFICPYCYFIFSSRGKRTRHIYNVHFRKKKMEEEDRVKTINEEGIPATIKTEPPTEESGEAFEVGSDMNPSVKLERIYLCPVCHYVFTSVTSLNKHVITHESITECPICKYECETNFELKDHLATHSSEESRHPCTICDMKFSTLGKLKYHIRDKHSKQYQCPHCLRVIKTENALRLHIEAHSRLKEYYCPKCKFATKNSSLLQYHMSRYHPPKKRFTCELCNKSYKYKYSLQRHHENCPGKDLPYELQNHKNGDEGGEIEIDISQKERLSCSECRATFKEAVHLKKHLLVHFHMKPFRCLKCGLRCKTKHTLSEHMKIHNIKANYECRICHKKFKQKHALNNHSIIHSDMRPFACELCGMTFKRKANYRRHYDIHSDIKPFRCHTCNFTSRRKDGLQKHLQIHVKV